MKKLLVISSAPLIFKNGKYFAYSPYEKEMNIWAKYSDEIFFCCPIWKEDSNLLISEIKFDISKIITLKDFNVKSILGFFKAFFYIFINLFIINNAMKQADHIHLRCPGNMGLLGAIVQIFFPNKKKTAKYAGNWDPSAKKPFTYKLQRWILSNTFLTRNMQVLVYGEWPNQTKNIKPFFTATYSQEEIQNSVPNCRDRIQNKQLKEPISFIFVGTLAKGKQPMYAIQIVEELHKRGHQVRLHLYGEGVLRKELEIYIVQNKLEAFVELKGNQSKETVLKAYQNSHFLLLPSKSEGWPKVVAEALIWSCVPIVTPVSCIPYMLNKGERGILLSLNLEIDINQIETEIKNEKRYLEKVQKGLSWSSKFTIDAFEEEIKKLLDYS